MYVCHDPKYVFVFDPFYSTLNTKGFEKWAEKYSEVLFLI